jgi:HAE1 family hydrophobic/amphiphilic exporter-1
MAMITIGGLLTSTLLTLVMVPVVYSLMDSATIWLTRLLRPAKTRVASVPMGPMASIPAQRSSTPPG